ncbi:hypothetical protein MES4922_210147 [Mesorhizobium ventifaucium]|uniref:Uncharacterized protein n=1 Tax=Mesorhizobium ventifaucium TaxID=666020 RepID=A0ABN8JTE6_9HYPH|nr:hypothetical protein MES4922_210147 [Mesorhizobium ventifaucium]
MPMRKAPHPEDCSCSLGTDGASILTDPGGGINLWGLSGVEPPGAQVHEIFSHHRNFGGCASKPQINRPLLIRTA